MREASRAEVDQIVGRMIRSLLGFGRGRSLSGKDVPSLDAIVETAAEQATGSGEYVRDVARRIVIRRRDE